LVLRDAKCGETKIFGALRITCERIICIIQDKVYMFLAVKKVSKGIAIGLS
jgi:hypothetical protein